MWGKYKLQLHTMECPHHTRAKSSISNTPLKLEKDWKRWHTLTLPTTTTKNTNKVKCT